ncbi:hypothetical protein GCM10010420_08110 [Streptomyces glaucosporus]|uniref:Uncharacterized protein n=1 Tax=Streptomyces glaucosporus TaxID=284044 RepID=A0ABP5UXP7_9ACTN
MPYGPTSGIADPLFGEIHVRVDPGAGRVEVGGPAVPPVVVRRTRGAGRRSRTAVGTRRAGRLAMTVDGEDVRVVPGRGWGLRRCHGVRVVHRGSRYRLTPGYLPRGRSRLTRDGRRLGRFRSDGRAAPAEWSGGAPVTARDAAVGYALAAAFGRRRKSWLWDAAEVVLDGLSSG